MAHPRGPAPHSIAPTVGDVQHAPKSSQQAFAVHLGPLSYALVWTCIYLFHAACALYCLAAAELFHVTQNTPIVQVFDASGMILAPAYFPAVAVVHCVVGAIHACFIAWPLGCAIYRFVTKRCHRGSSPRRDSVILSRLKSVRLPKPVEQYIPASLRNVALAVYARVFARQGLLGIESQQFDHLLLVREVFECGLQTYQAYQMSQNLPRRGLNRLFVATLVANCWVTPVLHHTIKHKPLRRLLDRLSDAALDFLASVGVPAVLVASYWPLYNPVEGGFPSNLWNERQWLVTIRTESPLVFFGSWLDALSRLVFSLGLLLSLDDIKILLRKQPRTAHVSAARPHASVVSKPHKTTRGDKVLRFGHSFLFGYGVVVLGVYVHSVLGTPPKACVLQLNPWFITKSTCAIVEFSCYTNRDWTGNPRDFESVFGNLHPLRLEHVSFRHCPSLELQPSIQQFPNLASLRFYNSTVRAWSAQAAVTNASHPKLTYISFSHTNFTDRVLPDGLLARDFPRSVIDLIFSATNLQHIPDDLDLGWPPGLALCLEFSPLAQFPVAFTRIQVSVLTLVGNGITEVPAEAFQVTDQMTLGLSGNPITNLPDDVTFAGGISVILLDSTNLTTVPAWLLDAATNMGTYVTAGGTPYCASVAADTTASASDNAPLVAETTRLLQSASLSGSFESTSLSRSTSLSGSASSSGSEPPDAPLWPPIDCTDTGPPYGSYQDSTDVREAEVW